MDQYDNARQLIRTYPSWVTADPDKTRVASYELYKAIYWTVPNAFRVKQRGSDSDPIYLPSARQIIETMHRYVAPKLSIVPDPNLGTPANQQAAMAALTPFLRRERFYSMFSAEKRMGLIRGDWMFHILANPDAEAGSRISIETLDPGSVFFMTQDQYGENDEGDNDPNTIVAVHIVELLPPADGGKAQVYRLTYRKDTMAGGPSPIEVSEGIYEADAWGGPDMDEKAVRQVRAPELLPPDITALPVYHISNFSDNEGIYGSSELRGFEMMMSAINQAISDEDLTLILQGLGVWTTDAGKPVDENGAEVPWVIAPAAVLEVPEGKSFNRVNGIESIQPYQDHLKFLNDQLMAGAQLPEVARGIVQAVDAESGIALSIKLAPVIDRAEEKELIITDRLINMFYDLRAWFASYETDAFGDAQWVPQYGDKIPVNRKQRFDELVALFQAKAIDIAYLHQELNKIGYNIADSAGMANSILEDSAAAAQIEADVLGARIDAGIADNPGTSGNPANA